MKLPAWKESVALYRAGNQAHLRGDSSEAIEYWQQASEHLQPPGTPEPQALPPLRLLRRIAVRAIAVILCFYVILFTLFPRQDDPFLMSLGGMAAPQPENRSFWDEFWDTGRPSHSTGRYLGTEDLWPLFRQSLEELMGNDSPEGRLSDDFARRLLERWLEERWEMPGGMPLSETDYYALAGRGLSNAREFEEALQTFREGLYYAESSRQLGNLHQEIGTTYYYQGYHLQPNGLAEYDLQLVRKSVEAYEEASAYMVNPYLFGNLGWGYYLLGDYGRSIDNSQRALAIDPTLNYVRMNLGITYLRTGDYRDSFEAYESILHFNPDGLEYEGGIRDLLELERESPGRYPFIRFVLGYIYLKQERFVPARQHLQEFLTLPFPEPYWKELTVTLLESIGA